MNIKGFNLVEEENIINTIISYRYQHPTAPDVEIVLKWNYGVKSYLVANIWTADKVNIVNEKALNEPFKSVLKDLGLEIGKYQVL